MIFFTCDYCEYISRLHSELQRHLKHCRVKSKLAFRKIPKSIVTFFHDSNIDQYENHFIIASAKFFHYSDSNNVDARRAINDDVASDERFNDAFSTVKKKQYSFIILAANRI